MKKNKIFITLFLITLILGYGFSSKIWFNPNKGNYAYKCPFEIDIMIDTQGINTNTIGISIIKNDSKFTINNFSSEGGIFNTYTTPIEGLARHGKFKEDKNKFFYIMGTTADSDGFNGKGKFGTITITPGIGVEELKIEYYMIPNFDADDSNISYYSGGIMIDSLSEAFNGKYNFSKKIKCENKLLDPIQIDSTPSIMTGNSIKIIDEIAKDIDKPTNNIQTDISKKSFNISNYIKQNLTRIIFFIIIILLILIVIFRIKKAKK